MKVIHPDTPYKSIDSQRARHTEYYPRFSPISNATCTWITLLNSQENRRGGRVNVVHTLREIKITC